MIFVYQGSCNHLYWFERNAKRLSTLWERLGEKLDEIPVLRDLPTILAQR